MKNEDMIRMAQEAGLVRFEGGELEAYGIAEASHDDHSRACWRIADEQRLKHFAALIGAASAAVEREECAKVCDDLPVPPYVPDNDAHIWDLTCVDCAEAIRARGKR